MFLVGGLLFVLLMIWLLKPRKKRKNSGEHLWEATSAAWKREYDKVSGGAGPLNLSEETGDN